MISLQRLVLSNANESGAVHLGSMLGTSQVRMQFSVEFIFHERNGRLSTRNFRELLASAKIARRLNTARFLGGLAAIHVPLIFILCGYVTDALATPNGSTSVIFGRWLPNFRRWLPEEMSLLAQVSTLLALGLVLLFIQSWCLLAFYRQIQGVAVEFETKLIQRLRDHARKLAIVRGLSGQELALGDALEYHLPRVRNSLSRWWRAYPRHLVQLVGCGIVAFLVQPMLMLLTSVAASLVIVVYRWLDRRRRTMLPVVRERAAQRRATIQSICIRGPLLETVHQASDISERFEQELSGYRVDAERSLASSAWKTPLVVFLSGSLACLFIFIVAIHILRPEAGLSLAGTVTFLLCSVGAAASIVRWERSLRELKSVQTAADDIRRLLAISADVLPASESRGLTRIDQHIELDHVTMRDSEGRKLLEDVSVVFVPRRLIGIISSQRLQASALAEMLMGFGRPISGRMLLDDTLISDIDLKSMTPWATWVSATGPLVTASIEANLQYDGKQLDRDKIIDALREARVLDSVERLPNGLATLVSDGDDRLILDAPFRLGIARAALLDRSLVVLDEPNSRVDIKVEQETTDAMRSLLTRPMITVVLPQRLTTLRQCETIVLLHEHKVADIGTHAELLQRSELYRHINYVRFSSLRHVTV